MLHQRKSRFHVAVQRTVVWNMGGKIARSTANRNFRTLRFFFSRTFAGEDEHCFWASPQFLGSLVFRNVIRKLAWEIWVFIFCTFRKIRTSSWKWSWALKSPQLRTENSRCPTFFHVRSWSLSTQKFQSTSTKAELENGLQHVIPNLDRPML